MYKCLICNFSTKNLTGYNRHNTSKTHRILVAKHEKLINIRRVNKLKREDKIINEINSVGSKIEKKFVEFEKAQKETTAGMKKILDYIKFLNKYCPDADPISLISDDDIEFLLELKKHKKNEFEESIIKYIKNKKLHIKIGDLILNKYLKSSENLNKQQIWTSDISRLIYLILCAVGKEKEWVRDKKGEVFKELIITPIIQKIKKIMLEYVKHCVKKFDEDNIENPENRKLLDKAQLAEQLLSVTYCKDIETCTLKYMASKFSVAVKKNELEDLYLSQ